MEDQEQHFLSPYPSKAGGHKLSNNFYPPDIWVCSNWLMAYKCNTVREQRRKEQVKVLASIVFS